MTDDDEAGLGEGGFGGMDDEAVALLTAWKILEARHGQGAAIWFATAARAVITEMAEAAMARDAWQRAARIAGPTRGQPQTSDAGVARLDPAAYARWQAREAFRQECREIISGDLPADPRQAAIVALERAADLVALFGDDAREHFNIRHPVAATLDHLRVALKDLDVGITDDVLRAVKPGVKFANATMREQARTAVAAYRALLQRGVPAPEASQRVGRLLKIRPRTITTWATRGRGL